MRKYYFLMFILCYTQSLAGVEMKDWKLQTLVPQKAHAAIKVSGEFRYRVEARNNFDFDGAKDDKDIFHLFRTRLNLQWEPAEFARGFMQIQDARIVSSPFASDAPFEDPVDFRQGFVEYYHPESKGLGIRLGRQELSYGAERLIGAFNWSNVSQSFDAAKAFYQFDAARVDVFAARRVLIDPSKVFNEWDDEDNLIGVYASCQRVKDHTLDIYYFYRNTDKDIVFGPNAGAGALNESTLGARILGKQEFGLDYQFESAFQFGDFGDQDICAWMAIALAGYTFDWPWSPRLAIEYDHGSGDENKDDGERNTFDNLFPTNHLFYGFMDLVSLQNIHDFVLSAGAKPSAKLSLKADVHLFFLDETSDSLYNAARTAVRTSDTTGVSDEVGSELDITVQYQICSFSALLAGYSHFFAGDFLSDSGKADDGDFFYFQIAVSF